MKKFLAVIEALMLLFSIPVQAKEATRLKVNLDIGCFNRYIGSISGQTIYDHHVFQQSLTFSDTPSGVYLKLWSSYSPKDGFNSDFGDEIDYIVGIYKTFYDGKLGIDMGYAFYNLYDIKNTESDFHAMYINVDLPKVYKIKPYLSVEGDIPENKEILEGGFLYKAGVKYDFSLPKSLAGQTVNLNLSAGGHDGAYGKKPEIISFSRLTIASTFKIWKVDITPQVNFQKRLGGEMAEDKIWYGVNFSIPLF